MTAKRSKIITAARAADRGTAREAAQVDDGEPRWPVWLGLAWLIGFCLFFYAFALPNNPPLTRADIWIKLPDLFSVSQLRSAPWGNLAQRADLLGVAAVIWLGAWGLGQLALRFVGVPLQEKSIERTFFAMALGMSATSLVTLGCGLAGLLNRWLFVALFALGIALELCLRWRDSRQKRLAPATSHHAGKGAPAGEAGRSPVVWIVLAAMAPFLFVMWLGSVSPDTDFDVLAYHFQGPKEYFQLGRITYLPHNVYTNFPFLTEMFALLGMVLHGNWYWGAVAGKCALFVFAPLTALGLYAAGRRWFSATAGLIAALVYLTTPWIDRITIIAYAEGGLAFYLFASLFAAMIAIDRMRSGGVDLRRVVLTGLLAGSGMACKYTGLIQVVLPMGGALVIAGGLFLPNRSARLRAVGTTAAAFSLGVAVTIGPWLVKNVALTGNPVYPLAYSVFGGIDRDPELDAQFRAGHAPRHDKPIYDYLVDVVANNDWSSPLWYGLAPLALFVRSSRRAALGLWLFVAYLFFTWWAFTHTIDRFWVPMIPVVSLLAGVGSDWRSGLLWRGGSGLVIALAVWFNLGFIAGSGMISGRQVSDLCGHNAFLADLAESRRAVEQPEMAFLNRTLPEGSKVLCIGLGEVFEAEFPVIYHTVFNKPIAREWFAARVAGKQDAELALKPAKDIRDKLHAEGITHVYVNWSWIRTYRAPGNYGYSEFVTDSRFERLVHAGVLGTPQSLGVLGIHGMSVGELQQLRARLPFVLTARDGRRILLTGFFDELSPQERATLAQVGPSLLAQSGGREVLINAQVFPVR